MTSVTEEQVLYFRARRGHLAGPGAPTAVAAARAIIGAQSQQLPPALLALSLRCRGRPTATKLKAQLLVARRLVRTWGQRETLHLYDSATDWPQIVAARGQLEPGGRRGPMPSEATLDKALAVMKSAAGPVTRSDLISVAPRSYVSAVQDTARAAGLEARRLAAARLIWRLALRGDACLAEKVGQEQTYAPRSVWLPKLKWPRKPQSPLQAATDLARRYLAVYGAATAADVAHFFGARVTTARRWLAQLNGELSPVSCGDRKGLVALTGDIADLTTKPPAATTRWPLRLLPLWDSMLMGHADKSWTVPDETDRKAVWRKGAYVAAVALARGRVVATWSHSQRRGRLVVEVRPLSRWSPAKHAVGVRQEADAVAAHLELDGADVTVAK